MKDKRTTDSVSPGRNPAQTRVRILGAALREFAEKGFAGARVDRIARRARINKRMLYHYFGDKEGLFREILRRKIAERAAWVAPAPEDPVERLPFWFELACRDPEWIRPFDDARKQLPRILTELDRMMQDNPDQLARTRRVHELAQIVRVHEVARVRRVVQITDAIVRGL